MREKKSVFFFLVKFSKYENAQHVIIIIIFIYFLTQSGRDIRVYKMKKIKKEL